MRARRTDGGGTARAAIAPSSRAHGWGKVALLTAVLAVLGNPSCLPADTRPPPGSILLLVSSADQPTTVTDDGWSITIDRLLLAMGDASLGFNCKTYSESDYLRLLDARITTDQKLVVLYGEGRCYFDFGVRWPTSDTVLGEGITEADRDLMAAPEMAPPGQGSGI